MSDKEILEKAIQKAIDGGWEPSRSAVSNNFGYAKVKGKKTDVLVMTHVLPEMFIFNHDFAKALWGNIAQVQIPDKISHEGTTHMYVDNSIWQSHLQNMVISDDPIAYLGENI